MRFSIVVPVYNVSEYLPQCIDSVLSQDFRDFELLLVDDGSTDASSNLCDKYKAYHPEANISVFHKQNEGQLQTRYFGFLRAKGEYVVPLDGDDSLRPDALRTLNSIIEEYKCDIVCFNSSRKADYSDKYRNYQSIEGFYRDEMSLKVLRKYTCGSDILNNLWGKAFRSSLVQDFRDYVPFGRLQMGEDLLQSLELFDLADSAYVIDEPLYYYRPNAGSVSRAFKLSQLNDMELVRDEADLFARKWADLYRDADFCMVSEKMRLLESYRLLQSCVRSNGIDFETAFDSVSRNEKIQTVFQNGDALNQLRLDIRFGLRMIVGGQRFLFKAFELLKANFSN